jgi:hypothetical protein
LFQPESPKNGTIGLPGCATGVKICRTAGEKAKESPKALKSTVETNRGVVLRPRTVVPNAPDRPT